MVLKFAFRTLFALAFMLPAIVHADEGTFDMVRWESILDGNNNPIYETVAAHTEKITESLKEATWQSFGLHLGVKYAF